VAVSDSKPVRVLERSLKGFKGKLTAADAAARSGLPTREAAEGLAGLAAGYSGHLAVTSKGELIYEFPRGLVPTGQPGMLRRIGRGLLKAVAGTVRLVVRAWVSVVLVGYAVVFGVVLIALAARSEEGSGIGDALALLVRIVLEALWWTFHPFSPYQLSREPGWVLGSTRKRKKNVAEVPFYERVNRFVFGPRPPAVDPRAAAQLLLGEIRKQQGRVVPADVMRVTGQDREGAERALLRLVADHEGEITVSEEGAIVYEFPALRSTAAAANTKPPADSAPIWNKLAVARPLTGNSLGFNLLVGAINGFNLVASYAALSGDWTIERLLHALKYAGAEDAPPLPPADGISLAFGLVPFLFSATLFVLPMVRALGGRTEAARVKLDNHVRLVLKRLLAGAGAGAGNEEQRRFQFTLAELSDACAIEGQRPRQADVERAVRALGGSVDLKDDGTLVYTFDDLSREHAAVRRSRALASPDEARPGAILLSSADEGHGIRDDPEQRR
jgi:hypothetical protein